MHNVERSVERIDGVRRVEVDLNTGRATVQFEPKRAVSASTLWEAIKDSGFTPVRVEAGGAVYSGPEE